MYMTVHLLKEKRNCQIIKTNKQTNKQKTQLCANEKVKMGGMKWVWMVGGGQIAQGLALLKLDILC